MKALTLQPNLVEQVRDAILDEITAGHLAPGERIIQEQIAHALGVSRQPVQQALIQVCPQPSQPLWTLELQRSAWR